MSSLLFKLLRCPVRIGANCHICVRLLRPVDARVGLCFQVQPVLFRLYASSGCWPRRHHSINRCSILRLMPVSSASTPDFLDHDATLVRLGRLSFLQPPLLVLDFDIRDPSGFPLATHRMRFNFLASCHDLFVFIDPIGASTNLTSDTRHS